MYLSRIGSANEKDKGMKMLSSPGMRQGCVCVRANSQKNAFFKAIHSDFLEGALRVPAADPRTVPSLKATKFLSSKKVVSWLNFFLIVIFISVAFNRQPSVLGSEVEFWAQKRS